MSSVEWTTKSLGPGAESWMPRTESWDGWEQRGECWELLSFLRFQISTTATYSTPLSFCFFLSLHYHNTRLCLLKKDKCWWLADVLLCPWSLMPEGYVPCWSLRHRLGNKLLCNLWGLGGLRNSCGEADLSQLIYMTSCLTWVFYCFRLIPPHTLYLLYLTGITTNLCRMTMGRPKISH